MKLTSDFHTFWLLFIFIGFPWLTHAFQEGGKASQDSAAIQQPQPISVNRLVTEMEELRTLIDLNSKKIVPSARMKRIA